MELVKLCMVHMAQKADQQNRVLMMSDKAHGDANPLLLIDENDVIAAHAASVGPVDKVQMNYLMSRGIPYDQAQKISYTWLFRCSFRCNSK